MGKKKKDITPEEKKLAILEEVINATFYRVKDDKTYHQRVKIKSLQNKQVRFKCVEDKHKHKGIIVAFDNNGNPLIYTEDKVTPIIDNTFSVLV